MPDLFGLDIAGILETAIDRAGGLRPATLVKVVPGARTPGSLTGGTNADPVSYATQGTVTRGNVADPGTLTRREDVSIMLLGAALGRAGVEPEVGDRVIVDGVTYAVTGPVGSDPAAATYTFPAAGA